MSKTEKVKISDALRATKISFKNENGTFVITDGDTKALFGYLVDNRLLVADRMDRFDAMLANNEQLAAALEGMLNITKDSSGVCGYHHNGDVAEWAEFQEVLAAQSALAAHKNNSQ